jgi:hypothetical protein
MGVPKVNSDITGITRKARRSSEPFLLRIILNQTVRPQWLGLHGHALVGGQQEEDLAAGVKEAAIRTAAHRATAAAAIKILTFIGFPFGEEA